MPQYKKRRGRWYIRFIKNDRTPREKTESLPESTPLSKVREIEGLQNAAFHSGAWDPWVHSWEEYQRYKQLKEQGVIDSSLTVKESIDVYIDKLSVRGRLNSEDSERNYRSTLGRFSEFLGDPFMLRDLSPRHAEMFLRTLSVKESTMGEYATRISTYYGYWHGRGMVRETFEYNRKQKPREDQIKYLSEGQKNKLTSYYRNNRDKILKHRRNIPPGWMDIDDIIDVLFYQGFRRSEVFDSTIQRKDVDLAAGKVKVFGKGNKHRVVDITPPAQRHFRRAYMATTDPGDNLIPVSDQTVYKILKDMAKEKLGSEYDWVSLHTLRHSCATYWAGLGVPIGTVQKLLGHTSIDTTMIYAKITDQSSKDHFNQAYNKDTPITRIGNGNE